MQRWVVVIVALGACVDIPAYHGDLSVSWVDADGGGTMSSSNVVMHFATGDDNYHLPDDLRMNNTPLLGHSDAAGCGGEDLAGIALYPEPRVAPRSLASQNGNIFAATLRGPAAASVMLNWGSTYTCDGPESHFPGGLSRFTMFPNGQIVRYDEVGASDSTGVGTTAVCHQCETTAVGHWIVSTFWAFTGAAFDNVINANTGPPLPAPSPTNEFMFLTNWGCLEHPGAPVRSVDIAWSDLNHGQNRIHTIGAGSSIETIAIVHDLDTGATINQLDGMATNSRTSLSFQTTACGAVPGGAAMDLMKDNSILVGGSSVNMGLDGIYGGVQRDGTAGVPVSGTIKIEGPTLTAFAVWLHFDSITDSLNVTKGDGQMGPWFVPQRFDDTDWIVWFRDSLDGTQSITIEPR